MFTSFAGLPLHPFIIHLTVVAAPLAAITVAAVVVVPAWRRRGPLIAVVVAAVAAIAVLISKESGEALLDRGYERSRVSDHAFWADILTLSAFALLAVTVLLCVSCHLPGVVTVILRVLALAAAAVVMWTVVATGHAGAELVWADEYVAKESLNFLPQRLGVGQYR